MKTFLIKYRATDVLNDGSMRELFDEMQVQADCLSNAQEKVTVIVRRYGIGLVSVEFLGQGKIK